MSADHDYMNTDDMCPNCVTPWKCNGPHLTTWQNSTENGTEMTYSVNQRRRTEAVMGSYGLDLTYRDTPITDALRDIWDEHCENYCVSCLDSDYPRNAVIKEADMAFRVAAFGAIRRAAAKARDLESAASVLSRSGDPKTRARVALQFRMEARAMRRAIRAALNTEKKA